MHGWPALMAAPPFSPSPRQAYESPRSTRRRPGGGPIRDHLPAELSCHEINRHDNAMGTWRTESKKTGQSGDARVRWEKPGWEGPSKEAAGCEAGWQAAGERV